MDKKELIKQLRKPTRWWSTDAMPLTKDCSKSVNHLPYEAAVALEAQQWQPIDDDAKTGKPVLAYFPLEGLADSWCRVVPVIYYDKDDVWNFAGRAASNFSREYQPTHYMPLPTPPKDKDPIAAMQKGGE